jgi:hypothetical protein
MGLGHALHRWLSGLIMSDHDERFNGGQQPREIYAPMPRRGRWEGPKQGVNGGTGRAGARAHGNISLITLILSS